jgi:hypothetical protein
MLKRPAAISHEIAQGGGKAIRRMNGVNRSEITDILQDFARLPTDAQAAFAHTWVTRTAARLEETWPMFYRLLKIVKDEEIYKRAVIIGDQRSTKAYSSFAEYFEAVVKQPFQAWHELEETYHFVASYAPDLLQRSYSEARGAYVHRHTLSAAHDPKTGTVLPEGRPRKLGNFPSFSQGKRAQQNGISDRTMRKLDRLARDFPDFFELVQQGKISVHRAAKAAGFVKTLTPLDTLKRAWQKASESERAEFAEIVALWKETRSMKVG